MPLTDPPLQDFTVLGSSDFVIRTVTSGSIKSFSFRSDKLVFNVDDTGSGAGYFYVTFPKELLKSPYQVFIDSNLAISNVIETGGETYMFFDYPTNDNTMTIEIDGNRTLATRCSGPHYTLTGIEYWIIEGKMTHPTHIVSQYT
jgi:hypothetical protein